MPLHPHLERMRREAALRRLAVPPRMDPQEQQQVFWPDVLEVECEFCYAEPGEPCLPMGIAMPHQRRIREARS